MINAEMMQDAEQRRLAWRCRRGMLELDILLQRFVASQFGGLTLEELQYFDEMLDLPDTEFLALIQGVKKPSNASLQNVLDKLNMTSLEAGKELT